MGRKSFPFAILAALVVSLSGCQLAQNAGTGDANDQLVGVYVTTEHVDLFDTEAFLNDNTQKILTGEDIMVDGRQYAERLYGKFVEGEDDPYYEFDGVKGFPFSSLNIKQGKDLESGYDISHHLEGGTLDATLYVPTGNHDYTFFFNPIYQTKAGEVYLVPGAGLSGDLSTAGTSMSQEIKEETTVIIDGTSTQETVRVNCTITSVDLVDRMIWVQMDQNCRMLRKTEVQTSQAPETFTPEPETAFILVENYKADREAPISREIIGREADGIEAYENPKGCSLTSRITELLWK